jgi:hypothetical protein
MPYIYPTSDQAEIPYWVLFYNAPYSVLAQDRTRAAILSRAYDYVQLPLPTNLEYEAAHSYAEDSNSSLNPQFGSAATEINLGGRIEVVKKMFLDPLIIQLERLSSTSTFRSYGNMTEMRLVSEARREFTFDYILVPKNFDDSVIINGLCNYFRASSYPWRADSPEKIYPPSLWAMQVVGAGDSAFLTQSWLSDPLVCVLTNVVINKIPFEDKSIARVFQDGSSMATSITLLFKEFETGTYDPTFDRVLSKSEIAVNQQSTP